MELDFNNVKKPGENGIHPAANMFPLVETAKAREAVRQEGGGATARLSRLEDGAGRYRTIYMDPPWGYMDRTCRGAAAGHYETMSVERIAEMPIGKLLLPQGGYLWLWATWPKIRDGFPHTVLSAWGFEWKSEIVWDKDKMGPGRWLRKQTEILILASKGRARPADLSEKRARTRDIEKIRRTTTHSAKPDDFRQRAFELTGGPMIELFARSASPLCDRWGHEAPATATEPAAQEVTAQGAHQLSLFDFSGAEALQPAAAEGEV